MKIKQISSPRPATILGGTVEEYRVGYLKGDFAVVVYHLGSQKKRSFMIHNWRTRQEVREGLLLFEKIVEGMNAYLDGDDRNAVA